ncbi:MAG: hypothetical protein H0T43_01290 [Solirubrobacterales bacterium]|nr:hypothetical protein [Solirubrobacterales bacterium]
MWARRPGTAGRLALVVALAMTAGVATGAREARAFTLGIADQQASTFADARLTGLGVRHARVVVAWDAMRHRWQRAELDAWMQAARAAGVRPLVTFGPSRRKTGRILPAVRDYARQTGRLRRRYPHLREFSPWNEPNMARLAVNNDPRRIAGYYRALRAGCPSCTVLGADVVDSSSLERWMRAYVRQFAAGRRPRVWGLHNYVDANSASSWGTRTMLRLAGGRIWFTETGAIIRRAPPAGTSRSDRRHRIRAGHRHARAATRRVFALARLSPRITRVYIYHWRADAAATWDSGLLSPGGAPRAAFEVFSAQARRQAGR